MKTLYAAVMCLLCLSVPAVFASTPPLVNDDDNELPLNITADLLHYSDQRNYLIARGHAVFSQGTRTLTADKIKINLVTRDTQAQGNVVLDQDGDIIECDSFNINLDTQLGTVRQAKIFIKKENIHIKGKEIQKSGPNSYKVLKGVITTCDTKNPAWRIDASEIDVQVDGYAIARNPWFKIKGIPILYLPFMFVPVKQQRESGFLFPEMGHSRKLGWAMGNSFFWAINDETDATFWLDTTTRKGLGGGLEYRFKLSDQTSGKFYGYLTDEESDFIDDQYRDPLDRDHTRYYLNFEGQHYFDDDLYVKADVSQISDRQFYHDYKTVVKRSKGDISRSECRNYEKEESTVFLNKNWETSNLLLNMNWYRELRYRDPFVVQRLPQISYSTMLQPIDGTPLFYQFEAGYDYFWRERGQRGNRINVHPKVSMPMMLGGWLKFSPEVGLRGVYHFGLNRNRGYDRDGMFPTVNAVISTTFVRIFNIDGTSIKKLRHTIEPGLRYEYVGYDDQREYPDFDRPEEYFSRHEAGYYIKNRLSALFADASGELFEHELGYFMLGQAFNLAKPSRGLYYEGDRSDFSSDIFAELRLDLYKNFYLKAKSYYMPYEQRLRRFNILGRLSNAKDDFIRLEYRYWRDLYEVLEFETYFHVTSWLALFLETRYDYLDGEDFDTELGIEYDAQCWGWRLWIEADSDRAGKVQDTKFKYVFFIKGFGDQL